VKRTLEERFWEKVDKNGPIAIIRGVPSQCWIWIASRDPRGYGHIGLNRSLQRAHRVSLRLADIPIPDDLVVDHLCRNPSCVNPDHIEPVTQRENVKRALRNRKTHCKNGHPLIATNLRAGHLKKRGWRQCRTCQIEYMRKYNARRALRKKSLTSFLETF
jgi:HNH endonuclease